MKTAPTLTATSLALVLSTLVLSSVFLSAPALAATAGHITHLSGTLSVKRADGTTKLLSIRSEVQEGDTLSTESETYARVKFVDGAEVVLRPGSQLKVDAYAYQPAKPESDNVILSMFKGGLRAVTGLLGKRNRNKVSVNTATATIGIRGTHFGALFCQGDCSNVPTTTGRPPANGLHVDVADGAIVLKNGAGETLVNTGQFGFVANASTLPVIVPPNQGIQVTMPQSISQNKSGSQGIGKSEQTECGL
jgi:hypothetical protein